MKVPPRLERVASMIESQLEQEPMILDVLVGALAKGAPQVELWAALHAAAIRDSRIAELAFAYEQLLGGSRIKLLPPAAQADVLAHAAVFFDEILGDAPKAEECLRRALGAVPTHAEAFARLESIITARRDRSALI